MIAQLNFFAFGSLFVELAVVTPVEWRTFVSLVPASKKYKLVPIFSKNILVMYISSVKKQKTGRKTGKNPAKKGVSSPPPDQILPSFRKWCAPFVEFCKRGAPFVEFCKRCAPFAEFRKRCKMLISNSDFHFFGRDLPSSTLRTFCNGTG